MVRVFDNKASDLGLRLDSVSKVFEICLKLRFSSYSWIYLIGWKLWKNWNVRPYPDWKFRIYRCSHISPRMLDFECVEVSSGYLLCSHGLHIWKLKRNTFTYEIINIQIKVPHIAIYCFFNFWFPKTQILHLQSLE